MNIYDLLSEELEAVCLVVIIGLILFGEVINKESPIFPLTTVVTNQKIQKWMNV